MLCAVNALVFPRKQGEPPHHPWSVLRRISTLRARVAGMLQETPAMYSQPPKSNAFAYALRGPLMYLYDSESWHVFHLVCKRFPEERQISRLKNLRLRSLVSPPVSRSASPDASHKTPGRMSEKGRALKKPPCFSLTEYTARILDPEPTQNTGRIPSAGIRREEQHMPLEWKVGEGP